MSIQERAIRFALWVSVACVTVSLVGIVAAMGEHVFAHIHSYLYDEYYKGYVNNTQWAKFIMNVSFGLFFGGALSAGVLTIVRGAAYGR